MVIQLLHQYYCLLIIISSILLTSYYSFLMRLDKNFETCQALDDQSLAILNNKKDGLRAIHFIGYSLGHFANDLNVSIWLLYILYYMDQILGLDGKDAGVIYMVGQMTDGCAVILTGLTVDKVKLSWCGTHIFVYSVASIFVLSSFFFFLTPQFMPSNYNELFIYITILVGTYSFVWGFV